LRVNLRKHARAAYLERLHGAGIAARAIEAIDSAIVLEAPVPVTQLPGFADGDVSVQDAAAQLATLLLDVPPGARVLDACAAPGGKSAHLLERAPGVDLLALDVEAARVALIEQNLQRLGLAARVRAADATAPASWWDGQAFDRILADVPCSATGVIRRHPDIKLRRQAADLEKLNATQTCLLEALWPLLRPGGKLLYVTCSVLAAENEQPITAFLERHADAVEAPLELPAARRRRHGVQFLPGLETMDGFFYACLVKR
jgi:16S rRNA (cytosine967-C5)-methyltransferase